MSLGNGVVCRRDGITEAGGGRGCSCSGVWRQVRERKVWEGFSRERETRKSER